MDFKLPEAKAEVDEDSGEDDSMIFEDKFSFYKSKVGKSKINSPVNSNSNVNMVALERILEASNIYEDYLQTKGLKKRASIFDIEINPVEKSKLPQ